MIGGKRNAIHDVIDRKNSIRDIQRQLDNKAHSIRNNIVKNTAITTGVAAGITAGLSAGIKMDRKARIKMKEMRADPRFEEAQTYIASLPAGTINSSAERWEAIENYLKRNNE